MQLPLNVSPVSASFIGLQRLGIHRVLSLACVASLRSLAHALFWRRQRTRRSKLLCLSLVLCLLFALGKIEVILSYSVFQVQGQEALTTGKWKHNRPSDRQLRQSLSLSALSHEALARPVRTDLGSVPHSPTRRDHSSLERR